MLSHINNKHPVDKQDKYEILQKIRNPKRIKEISSTGFLFTMVLPKVDKVKDVVMPRLKVDSKSAGSFVASLVNVTGSRVVCPKHGDDTVGVAISTGNV